jgi:hypothetical protein
VRTAAREEFGPLEFGALTATGRVPAPRRSRRAVAEADAVRAVAGAAGIWGPLTACPRSPNRPRPPANRSAASAANIAAGTTSTTSETPDSCRAQVRVSSMARHRSSEALEAAQFPNGHGILARDTA